MPVVHATFTLENTYPHTVDAVFKAFADPALKARWLNPPGGAQDGDSLEIDFRLGGMEHARWIMGADTPFPGAIMTSDSLFLDIIPNHRIVTGSNMMMNGTPFSASLMTFEFEPDGNTGTRLICTHDGAFLENSDGPEMRQDGWRQLFERLAQSLNTPA